jgi:hypothetical protein
MRKRSSLTTNFEASKGTKDVRRHHKVSHASRQFHIAVRPPGQAIWQLLAEFLAVGQLYIPVRPP